MNGAATLELPDDPILLKQMILQRDSALALCDVHIERIQQEAAAALAQREADIAQREAQLEQIKREAAERIEALVQQHKAEMAAILRRFYGPKGEKFDPRQLLIFGLAVAEQIPVDEKVVEAETGEKPGTRRVNHHKHGRGALPAHLPRVEIPHDLSDEQKPCPCCREMRLCIGSEVSEQLEFVSASFQVLKHVRYKYACKACDQNGEGANIEIAAPAAGPIEKGLPGPGLVAHVVVSKLGDHLPLYRLEKIFARQDVDIARSTMCAWMLSAGELIKPLVELMALRVKQSRVIHTDDTRVPVLPAVPARGCRSGRIWPYIGDGDNPYIIYEYTPDRTRAGPQRFLEDYAGYLQADAYGGYDGIFTCGKVIEVACWAHARRKFFEARETDGRRSAQMLEMVRRLYVVEDQAKEQIAKLMASQPQTTADQRYELIRSLRQEKSLPILAQIKTWLDVEKELVLPRSPMGGAITYVLNQWEALNRYQEQGYLNIDNNAAERAVKRVAIGRKNWLFAGHDESGASHARLWSLIASAERHGVDPQRYLTSVLAKIGQTKLSELDQFLPDVWKAAVAAEAAAGAPITGSQTPRAM
jgi:transposase